MIDIDKLKEHWKTILLVIGMIALFVCLIIAVSTNDWRWLLGPLGLLLPKALEEIRKPPTVHHDATHEILTQHPIVQKAQEKARVNEQRAHDAFNRQTSLREHAPPIEEPAKDLSSTIDKESES